MSLATDLKHASPILPHNTGPSAVWSSAGHAYDEISRGIADAIEHGINRLEPRRGERILDLASGTGWAGRRLAQRGFTVTAADFAPDMLATAQRLAAQRNLDITFDIADAEALPYEDASFDAVISTLGVMFVQRPEAAAAELARVCRRNGRIVLVNWTSDGNVFEMFRIMKAYMAKPAGTPPPSPFEWGREERVRELLGGKFGLAFENGTSFYREPSGAAAWDTFVAGYGPLRTLANRLEPEARENLKKEFIAFHDGFATGLGICVPRTYLVVKGVHR